MAGNLYFWQAQNLILPLASSLILISALFIVNMSYGYFVDARGKRMLARAKGAAPGNYTGGRIVNIASMAGLRVLPQSGVYCMSKAAVVHMTKAMAVELAPSGVRVVSVAPTSNFSTLAYSTPYSALTGMCSALAASAR